MSIRRRSTRAAARRASLGISAILTPRKHVGEMHRVMSLEHEDFDEEVDLDYEQEEEDEEDEDDLDALVEEDDAVEETKDKEDDYREDEDEDYVPKEGEEDDDDDDEDEGDEVVETNGKGATKKSYDQGTNWVGGGIDKSPFLYLCLLAPFICQVLAYITSEQMAQTPLTVTALINAASSDPQQLASDLLAAILSGMPSVTAVKFLLGFNGLALVLERLLPGQRQYGPETLTGHKPVYTDNGWLHCLVFSHLFVWSSNLGYLKLFDLGVVFDEFVPMLTALNIFGLLFSLFLYYKGLKFPSTNDCGSSGSFLSDFLWGTELYPRICGVDIKRFINCRFSMSFWQLAGLCFVYRSYTLHGQFDWGLVLSAVSQYLYLLKFFWWEMGYMRSIDIIVDRAGFEIQWGCLVWVPAVYTMHTRFLVMRPSQLELVPALVIFLVGLAGVALNFAADNERQQFREANGKMKVWGNEPRFITAQYTVIDPQTGKESKRTSLLLASGYWGVARHFHYVFELMAAWSWCLLANPLVNGIVPLVYSVFLTSLLIQRAKRDEEKCQMKYGKHYAEYSKLVPYLILPGIY